MKKVVVIILALFVIAMFVVSGCQGNFTGNAKYAPGAKKALTVEKPFDVMKARFTDLGLSEDQMWKKIGSSNILVYQFNGNYQVGFATRQINDPKTDAKTKEATKAWVINKINTGVTAANAKDIALLIIAEDTLKANTLKVSSFSSNLPLDPKKLKKIMDAGGESIGGAKTPAGGTPPPSTKGGDLAACVGSVAMKGAPAGSRSKDDALFGKQKQTGVSTSDSGKDSTNTEAGGKAGSMEGQDNVIGMAGPCKGLKVTGGNSGISEGNPTGKAYYQKKLDEKYGWKTSSVDLTKGTVTTKEFTPTTGQDTNGKIQGTTTTHIEDQAGKIVGEDKTTPSGAISVEKNAQNHKDAVTDATKNGKILGEDKPPQVTKTQDANPMEGSDAPAAGSTDRCAAAVNNCASSVDGDSPKAQLKKLAQDCQNAAAQGAAADSQDKANAGNLNYQSKKPAPGACDKVSSQCMNDLLKGPTTDNGEDMSGACALSSKGALGFSEQAMFTDPVDFSSAAALNGLAAQTAQKATTGSASSKSTTGTSATASTGASSSSSSAQKAATGSGECVGDNC